MTIETHLVSDTAKTERTNLVASIDEEELETETLTPETTQKSVATTETDNEAPLHKKKRHKKKRLNPDDPDDPDDDDDDDDDDDGEGGGTSGSDDDESDDEGGEEDENELQQTNIKPQLLPQNIFEKQKENPQKNKTKEVPQGPEKTERSPWQQMVDFFVHGLKGAMIKNGNISTKKSIINHIMLGLGFKSFKKDILLQKQAQKYWDQKLTGKKVDLRLLNTDLIDKKISQFEEKEKSAKKQQESELLIQKTIGLKQEQKNTFDPLKKNQNSEKAVLEKKEESSVKIQSATVKTQDSAFIGKQPDKNNATTRIQETSISQKADNTKKQTDLLLHAQTMAQVNTQTTIQNQNRQEGIAHLQAAQTGKDTQQMMAQQKAIMDMQQQMVSQGRNMNMQNLSLNEVGAHLATTQALQRSMASELRQRQVQHMHPKHHPSEHKHNAEKETFAAKQLADKVADNVIREGGKEAIERIAGLGQSVTPTPSVAAKQEPGKQTQTKTGEQYSTMENKTPISKETGSTLKQMLEEQSSPNATLEKASQPGKNIETIGMETPYTKEQYNHQH